MNEAERIADLEEEGYSESDRECRRCGTTLMYRERWQSIAGVYAFDEIQFECPHCGLGFVEYET